MMKMKAVRKACTMCNTVHCIVVPLKDYRKWKRKRGLIQDVMPYLCADLRELLLSGCCGSCFDEIFGKDEDHAT